MEMWNLITGSELKGGWYIEPFKNVAELRDKMAKTGSKSQSLRSTGDVETIDLTAIWIPSPRK